MAFTRHVRVGATWLARPAHAWSRFVLLGDSIPVYDGGAPTQSATELLAAGLYPGTVVDKSVGGRELRYYAEDSTKIAAALTTIGSAGTPTEVYIAMGYNDAAIAAWTAAQFGAGLRALVTAIRAQWPSALVLVQTILQRSATVDPYTFQIRNCGDLLERPAIEADRFGVVSADRIDSIHLGATGHQKLAAGIAASVGW